MKHPAWPLLAAAGSVTGGGWLFAITEHVPFTTGCWWALVTASTVGFGDVVPHDPHGRLVAALVILTAIPSLAAAWNWAAARHAVKRLAPHLASAREDAAAARRIAAALHKHLTGEDHPDAPGGTPP